jgi:hypothetical protein
VEYDWKESGQTGTTLEIKVARLTIDCPNCGVRAQDHWLVAADKDRACRR